MVAVRSVLYPRIGRSLGFRRPWFGDDLGREATLMAPAMFDSMTAAIDVADEVPALDDLAAMPRRITR